MGRSKPSVDEPDLVELLNLKDDVLANREETTGLREEVDLLRKEDQNTNSKQDAMTKVISTITDVLKTLQQAPDRVGVEEQEQQPEKPSEADEIQKEGAEEHQRSINNSK